MLKDTGGSRGSVLVVFPDDWAPFSPTLTRLVDLLSTRFNVRVLAFDTGRFDLGVLDQRHYVRVPLPHPVASIVRAIGLLRVVRTFLLAIHIRKHASRTTQLVAIDADGATATWLAQRRMHYLSLEVARPSLASFLVPRFADSIVIQSKERLDYQFRASSIAKLPVFYVQNAPIAPETLPRPHRCDPSHPKLVYMGNLIPTHGLLRMLDLLRIWPEATLTLQGVVTSSVSELMRDSYMDLFDSGRLSVENRYLEETEIQGFLSEFDIGICLYEPPTRGRMNFNYESSPSGKMFNYFAAGLPVLASRHVGLQPVSDYSAGIQAASNSASDLHAAGLALCRNHEHYRRGAISASQSFDFARAANRFIEFLSSTHADR